MNRHNAFGDRDVSFGDNVRIVSTELTESLGFAGMEGVVFGQTIPSTSGVSDIIGHSNEDYAVNVFFGDGHKGLWFRDDLVEFVSHGQVTVQLQGCDKEFVIGSGAISASRPQAKSWWQRLRDIFQRG